MFCASMFVALKRDFRSMASLILVRNVVGELRPKRTLAASRGFLVAARLSCWLKYCTVYSISNQYLCTLQEPFRFHNISVCLLLPRDALCAKRGLASACRLSFCDVGGYCDRKGWKINSNGHPQWLIRSSYIARIAWSSIAIAKLSCCHVRRNYWPLSTVPNFVTLHFSVLKFQSH